MTIWKNGAVALLCILSFIIGFGDYDTVVRVVGQITFFFSLITIILSLLVFLINKKN